MSAFTDPLAQAKEAILQMYPLRGTAEEHDAYDEKRRVGYAALDRIERLATHMEAALRRIRDRHSIYGDNLSRETYWDAREALIEDTTTIPRPADDPHTLVARAIERPAREEGADTR